MRGATGTGGSQKDLWFGKRRFQVSYNNLCELVKLNTKFPETRLEKSLCFCLSCLLQRATQMNDRMFYFHRNLRLLTYLYFVTVVDRVSSAIHPHF